MSPRRSDGGSERSSRDADATPRNRRGEPGAGGHVPRRSRHRELRQDLRHGLRIGRAEVVRSGRQLARSRRRLAGLAVAVLFFGGNLLASLPAAYAAGATARSLDSLPYFGSGATALPAVLLLVATFRTLERIGSAESESLLLTTVHPRAVVVGLVTAEVARLAAWFGVPLVAFAATFALGLGSPSLLATGGLVLAPLVCWAAVWGYAAGIAVLRILRWLPGLRRVLKVAGVLALVGAVVGSQFVGRYVVEEGVTIPLDALAVVPVADYVALAFAGTPLARPASVGGLAVLLGLVAATPLGLVVATRQASVLWFTDAPTRGRAGRTRTSAGGFAPPRPFAWRRAGRVAWGHLVRGVRSPQEFGHLVFVLFWLGPLATTVVQSSEEALGPLVAGVGVGLGAYLAGATFGLNPLGDDRPQMPLLLLTRTAPRTVVRGRVLAGVAVGAPVAVLVPLLTVAAGTAVPYGVAFAAVGVGACLPAALFAVGLGAAYPVYEEREFWGTETVVPSMLVMLPYTVVVGGGTAVALVATWFAVTGNLDATPLVGAGLGAYLLLTGGVSYGSYRYAVRRYRRYSVE